MQTYFCEVQYQTQGGNRSTWTGLVVAADPRQAYQLAQRRTERARKPEKIKSASARLVRELVQNV